MSGQGETGRTRQVVPFVNLQRMQQAMGNSLDAAFLRTLENAAYTMGPTLELFEETFASYIAVGHAVGVGSGTDALHLALRAIGAGPGSEIITAVNTFAATAEAIIMAGATPVFVDVDEETLLMDPVGLEQAITPNTKAIIPVHLYGQPVDMAPVLEIAKVHGLKVIEDACQSHGARYGLFRTGGIGDVGAFSFYPSKNLGALGDGGIVTTDDEEIADRVRRLRNHGEAEDRLHVEPGYCSRLHSLQAAFLQEKLPYLDEWNALRMRAAELYDDMLSGSNVVTPVRREGSTHVYHLYVVRVQERDRVRAELADAGIQTGIHYAVPLHLEPAFVYLGYAEGDFPVAEKAAREILSLPMYPYIDYDEVARVSEAVKEATGERVG